MLQNWLNKQAADGAALDSGLGLAPGVIDWAAVGKRRDGGPDAAKPKVIDFGKVGSATAW